MYLPLVFCTKDMMQIFIILVLGIFDTIFVISRFIYGVIESAYTNESYGPIHFVFPIMVPLNGFAYMCSTYLTVLLTFERYVAICHPYKVNLISKGKTWKCIDVELIYLRC